MSLFFHPDHSGAHEKWKYVSQLVKSIDDGGVSMYFRRDAASNELSRRVILQSRSKVLALCMFFPHRPKFQNMHCFACIVTTTRLQTLLHGSLFLELCTSSLTSAGIMKNNVNQNLKFSCQENMVQQISHNTGVFRFK